VFKDRFQIELELNKSNLFVSLALALFMACVPLYLVEFKDVALSPIDLTIACLAAAIVGFLIAERYPLLGRILPYPLVLSMAIFYDVGRPGTILAEKRAEAYERFDQITNRCEGYAYIKMFAPACMHLDSDTIKNHCTHVEGNEWECRLISFDDIAIGMDIVEEWQYLTDLPKLTNSNATVLTVIDR